PAGRLALMWNSRDRRDPLTRSYTDAIRAVNGEHPAEMRDFDPAVVSATDLFTPAAFQRFAHSQALDRAGLIGRATSASYVRKEAAALAELTRRLDELFERS